MNGESIGGIKYDYESYTGEGTLRLVSHYRDSNLIKSILYEDGQIKGEMNYKGKGFRILDGPFKTYKNGQLIEEEMYKNGKKDGPTKSYHTDGKLNEEVMFKNGEKNGYYKRYWYNGQPELSILIEGTYKNGEREGSFKEYKPNGSLKKEDIYENGIIIKTKTY